MYNAFWWHALFVRGQSFSVKTFDRSRNGCQVIGEGRETIFGGLPRRRSLSPRVSASRAHVLSFAHYFQAPATQNTQAKCCANTRCKPNFCNNCEIRKFWPKKMQTFASDKKGAKFWRIYCSKVSANISQPRWRIEAKVRDVRRNLVPVRQKFRFG